MLSLSISCSLDKDNPVYPNHNGEVPGIPIIDNVLINTTDSGKIVNLGWTLLNNAKGYFIYRSTSYNGYYDLIANISPNSVTEFSDNNVYSGRTYFYKMSAYDEKGLEGHHSAPKRVMVN